MKHTKFVSILGFILFSISGAHAQCPWNQQDVETLQKTSYNSFTTSELWEKKLNIRSEMEQVFEKGEFDKDCANVARDLFFLIREKEDFLDEERFRLEGVTVLDHSFEDSSYLRVTPAVRSRNIRQELKSGDILLTRGKAYTSAAISNLGEFDTQFSHMSLVYQDELGKFWTVEAHIEVGSFVRELQDHIDDKNARTVLYRYSDSEVAHQAAKAMFERVKKAFDTRGPINYDFGFDKKDSSELFCSEIISLGFDLATDGKLDVPLFESEIFKRKPKIVKQLGLKAQFSFIPADIEVDPRFELISEWKNPAVLSDILQKDGVLRALFKMSDEEGHVLKQASTGTSLIYRNIAWPLRRVPFLKKYFIEKLPLNMSREMVGYFGVLETIGKILQNELKKAEGVSLQNEGRILSFQEKWAVLDNFRKSESKQARKFRKSFRP